MNKAVIAGTCLILLQAEPAAGPVAGGVSGTDGEGRKRRRRDDYDHFDDFIDDSGAVLGEVV